MIPPPTPAVVMPSRAALDRLEAIAAEPDDDALRGAVVGCWQLEELIGHGAGSLVYRARHVQHRDAVAVKLLLPGADPARRQALLREVAAGQQLHHPAVASTHSSGRVQLPVIGEVDYVVSELVTGKTLASCWPNLEWAAGIEVLQRVSEAVGAVHAAGLVHLDINPRNVMIEAGNHVRLVDFGMARAIASQPMATAEEGGTPSYMAPEQLRNDAARIGPASDVWAIGVMLYQFICGRSPFIGRNTIETQLAIVRGSPPDPQQFAPDAPRALIAICRRALARAPEQRYPCGAALAADLARFRESIAPGSPLPSSPQHRSLWLAVGLISVGLVVLTSWHWVRERQTRLAEQQRRVATFEQAQEWLAVLRCCEQHRALANDPWLTAAAERARAALAKQALDEQQRRHGEQATRATQATLRQLAEHLERTRILFHLADHDAQRWLETTRDWIHRVAQESPTGHALEQATLLGYGYWLLGDDTAAEQQLVRADKLAFGEDAQVSYLLGQVYRERAIARLLEEVAQGLAPSNATRTALQRATIGWEQTTQLDRHLAAMWLDVARDHPASALARARSGLARFGVAPGAEQYPLLQALLATGAARRAAAQNALAVRPHYPMAQLLLALEALHAGEPHTALLATQQALRLAPTWLSAQRAHAAAGLMLTSPGRFPARGFQVGSLQDDHRDRRSTAPSSIPLPEAR
jgi:serine/threonine protein kinase